MGDLISRKALLKTMELKYKNTVRLIQSGETHLDNLAEGYTEVHNLIGVAQAVEAEPVRHGHWIMRGGKRYCSVCRERACLTRDMDDFWYTVGTDYCPTCGAKMDISGD